jgi:alpha/beta superfamily hydrolase
MTMNPWYERNFGLEPIPRANFDNCEVAHRLSGKLLVVYGELDEHVHPVHAIRFADALMRAGKEFELMVMPDANHFYYGRTYFLRRLFGFLTRHLLGYDPPPEPTFVDGEFEERFRYGPAGVRRTLA